MGLFPRGDNSIPHYYYYYYYISPRPSSSSEPARPRRSRPMSSHDENVALYSPVPPPVHPSVFPSPSRTRFLAAPAALSRHPAAAAASENEAQAVRLNVLHSSVQEARDARNSRLIMYALTLVHVPQILAALVVLVASWQRETLCYRIQVWVLLQTMHLIGTLLLEWTLYYFHQASSNRAIYLREQYMTVLSQVKYGLDLAGLFWFLVGNMWVLSDSARCDDGSAMYQVALWMIIIAYMKLFLPCVLLLALLPILCFCLPCVIRLLSRLQDPMRGKGATQELIDQLETKTYTTNMLSPDDACCCICLNTYEVSQSLRVLPCAHHFHKECVDEWLLVNSTCPTCRKSMFDAGARGAIASSEEDVLRHV